MSATSRRCLVKRRPFIQLAIISVVAAVNDGNAYYTATKRYSDIFNGKMEKEAIVEHEEKYFQVCIPFLLLFISCLFLFSFSFDISSNVSSEERRNSSSRKRILTGPAIEPTRRMTTFYRKSCLFYPISGIPWSRYGRPSINTLYSLPDKHFILSAPFPSTCQRSS